MNHTLKFWRSTTNIQVAKYNNQLCAANAMNVVALPSDGGVVFVAEGFLVFTLIRVPFQKYTHQMKVH